MPKRANLGKTLIVPAYPDVREIRVWRQPRHADADSNRRHSTGREYAAGTGKTDYAFGGWYTAKNGGGSAFTANTPVNGSVTVYAKWESNGSGSDSMPPGLSLNESLTWLDNNAVEGGAYTITLSGNETIRSKALSCSGKTASITLLGGATERMVRLSSNGALFTVESGVTLMLDNNITLLGWSNNTTACKGRQRQRDEDESRLKDKR
jgi:uncharacterized repeat protein (TIGR02543 family)